MAEDDRLGHERHSKYRGTARVKLDCLKADETPVEKQLFLRPQNVRRLRRIFAVEGCQRLPAEHHVPALISYQELEASIQRSGTSQKALYHNADELPPELKLPYGPLIFLHGRHRLQAARDFLSEGDDWWVVDLYLDDMNLELRNLLREEYSNSVNFSDGEIFRHIRFYQRINAALEERRWWARLTRDKSKDLKRILNVYHIREAFDSLLDITGLWSAFHIGTMRRYLVLKCHEELVTYLRLICRVWSEIANNDRTLLQLIDSVTVKLLELRAPGHSDEDARIIKSYMRAGTIFGAITNIAIKEDVIQNVLSVNRLIPSLRTFCEDTKYLEPCAKAMKRLLGTRIQSTVFSTMRDVFRRPHGSTARSTTSNKDFTECYRRLWTFAIRHFPDLVNAAPRKEPDQEKPVIKEPNPITWYRMARLAMRLGFETPSIQQLGSVEVLGKALRCTLKPILNHIAHDESLNHLVQRLRDRIATNTDFEHTGVKPRLTTDDHDLDLQHRCGRSFECSQSEAERSLYTCWIFDTEEVRDKYLTPFYVHRAIFRAFFGDEETQSTSSNAVEPSQHVTVGLGTEPANSEVSIDREDQTNVPSNELGRSVLDVTMSEAPSEPRDEEDRLQNGDDTASRAISLARPDTNQRASPFTFEIRVPPVNDHPPASNPATSGSCQTLSLSTNAQPAATNVQPIIQHPGQNAQMILAPRPQLEPLADIPTIATELAMLPMNTCAKTQHGQQLDRAANTTNVNDQADRSRKLHPQRIRVPLADDSGAEERNDHTRKYWAQETPSPYQQRNPRTPSHPSSYTRRTSVRARPGAVAIRRPREEFGNPGYIYENPGHEL